MKGETEMIERTEGLSGITGADSARDAGYSGWVTFAAMMMFGLGTFSLFAAIAELLNSSWLLENTLLGTRIDWFWYGFLDLLVAIGSFYAGSAILTGRAGGYVIGLIFATLSAGRWFLLIPKAPIWSVTMVVIWCLVIYALARTVDYAD
jgi:hypothetical protein